LFLCKDNPLKYSLTLKSKKKLEMRTNIENYKWGFIYYNPKDKRVIGPKLSSAMGWTLNFASPVTYIIIFALVALVIIVSF
jgi:uncharacterized membrane protein